MRYINLHFTLRIFRPYIPWLKLRFATKSAIRLNLLGLSGIDKIKQMLDDRFMKKTTESSAVASIADYTGFSDL